MKKLIKVDDSLYYLTDEEETTYIINTEDSFLGDNLLDIYQSDVDLSDQDDLIYVELSDQEYQTLINLFNTFGNVLDNRKFISNDILLKYTVSNGLVVVNNVGHLGEHYKPEEIEQFKVDGLKYDKMTNMIKTIINSYSNKFII